VRANTDDKGRVDPRVLARWRELVRARSSARNLQRSALQNLYSKASDCASKRKVRKHHVKHKKSRKDGRRRRSSSRSDSSDRSSSDPEAGVFREARGHKETTAGTLARRSPGALSRVFVQTLRTLVRGRGHSVQSSERDEDAFEPLVTTYVTSLLLPTHNVSKRNARELLTLAGVLDRLFLGELPEGCDILVQRFKAVETAAIEGTWVSAQHHELIPEMRLSTVSRKEQEEAIRKEASWNKVLRLANH